MFFMWSVRRVIIDPLSWIIPSSTTPLCTGIIINTQSTLGVYELNYIFFSLLCEMTQYAFGFQLSCEIQARPTASCLPNPPRVSHHKQSVHSYCCQHSFIYSEIFFQPQWSWLLWAIIRKSKSLLLTCMTSDHRQATGLASCHCDALVQLTANKWDHGQDVW